MCFLRYPVAFHFADRAAFFSFLQADSSSMQIERLFLWSGFCLLTTFTCTGLGGDFVDTWGSSS